MKIRNLIFITLCASGLKAQTLQDGLLALDYERYQHARNIFTQLVAQDAAKGIHHYYLGQTYWYLYQPDSARMSYEKGIAAEPANPANYAGLGELLLDDDKKAEAKVQFDKALGLSKNKSGQVRDINALRFVADAMTSAESKMTDSAAILIEQALELDRKNYDVQITAGDVYLEKNDGGKSATSYENAIMIDKANPKAYTRVANIWLRVRNAEATNNELKRAIEINPNYAPALKAYAEYYYLTRQYAKAKETYIKYLENSEPSAANKQRFARILFRSKEYAEALTQLQDILKVDKSDIFLYRLAGYSYYEVGVEKRDTSLFRQGIESMDSFMSRVDPKKIVSNDYEYLGKLHSKLAGHDSLAIYYMGKALETDPSKTELYKEAAMVYSNLKKHDKAAEYYEIYIAKASRLTAADYYLLGQSASRAKLYMKSDSAYAKVNDMKPDYADAYFQRGLANSYIDPEAKDTLAKYFFEKYISLAEPTPEKYKKNLAIAYNYLGYYAIQKEENTKAKEYYNKTLALDPENKDAKDVIKKLK